jgi:hypothetical protein
MSSVCMVDKRVECDWIVKIAAVLTVGIMRGE